MPNYTNKQINRILCIEELVEYTNILSKIYLEQDNKEFFIDNLNEKEKIYKLYCAAIFNLIKAIKESKEFFGKTEKYKDFEDMLNQKFIASDNKYYSKENYESSLFKIIETIRNQVNYYQINDGDNNVLFEAYIDFEIVEKLRKIMNDIFNEIYDELDQTKIKNIVLNKPKIKYSFDKLSNKVDELNALVSKDDNLLPDKVKKDSEKMAIIFSDIFNSEMIYDIFNRDPAAINKVQEADSEIINLFKSIESYINSYGSEYEKEAAKILKKYMNEEFSDNESINDINNKEVKMKEELIELFKKYNKQ